MWCRWRCTAARLPGGKKIKKGKLRGVESNGMLCSLGELGLTQHDFPHAIEDGIMVLTEADGCDLTLGKDIRDALGFHDTTVEFEITSNRPDCFSVIGLAREAAATFDLPVKAPRAQSQGRRRRLHGPSGREDRGAGLCARFTRTAS